jgi:methyl-accepting chemotaxis protein
MAGNAETITKPYPWTVDGKTNWLTSTGFPIQKNGKNIGVVGVDFYLTDLQKMVKKINPFGVGYGFLASNDGTIIAHPDDALLGKSLDEIVGRKQGQEYLQTLASRNPYSFEADFSKKGQEEYLTAKPIIIGNAPNAWSLAVVIPHKTVEAQANSVAETGILVGVGAVTVLLVLLFFLARLISLPVLKTAQFAKQVAAGNLDATLQINQKDETGVMVESLRTMIAKLKETISEAQGKAREAEEESDKACSAQLEAEKAKAQAVSARSSGLLHAAKEITLVLDHVVSATREMLRQSEGLLRNTEEQNDRINSTATAMEEMNATVLEIARNAGDASASGVEAQKTAEAGAQVVDQSKDAMNSTMAEVDDLNANMHMLDEQAKGIGSIINVINDIADQTNLLALNAAIEAARAGEAGRGFAVVADEVRKLAEKTMQATKEVSASISSIQQVADANIAAMKTVVKHIKNATELSNRSGEMLRDIVQGAEQSAEQIAGIATAAEEQSATSDEINNAVERISAITNQTADSARELSQALRSLEGQVAELNGIVEELKREGRA